MWVAVGLIVRNAWVRFGVAREWTLGATCLLLLTEVLTTGATNEEKRSAESPPNARARPPT